MKIRFQVNSDGAEGFTLIEALIALTLMVGILAALATITSQWLPNWNRGFKHVQRTELFARGLERLVADLAAAEFVTANGNTKQPLFEGNELSVFFVRSAIGPNTKPGLEFVRIATTADELGFALVRTKTSFGPLALNTKISDVPNLTDPVVLIRAPYRASFSYSGPDSVWQDSWREANQLPVAVRIAVRDAATQRTLAVSTISMLHHSASAECARAKDPRNCVYPPAKASSDAR